MNSEHNQQRSNAAAYSGAERIVCLPLLPLCFSCYGSYIPTPNHQHPLCLECREGNLAAAARRSSVFKQPWGCWQLRGGGPGWSLTHGGLAASCGVPLGVCVCALKRTFLCDGWASWLLAGLVVSQISLMGHIKRPGAKASLVLQDVVPGRLQV